MGAGSFAQTSFLGGEWSQFAQGRFDRPDYRTAMNVCLNAFPLEQGPWVRRPGTLFAGTTRGGAIGMSRPFDFKQSLPYSVEFTANFLRFRQGSTVVTTNDDVAVSAISSANPAEVTTAANHGWSTGNTVRFANLDSLTPLLHRREFKITVTASNKFTIVDVITGANIDGSTLGSLYASATAQRVLEVASPYGNSLWPNVRVLQAELQALILHPTVAPYLLTAIPPGVGQTYYSFTLVKANLLDGPYLDPFTNGVQVTPSATNGVVTLTLSFPTYSSTKAYSVGDFVTYSSVNYQSLVDQNQGNQPDTHPSQWKSVSAGLAIGPNGFVGTDINRLIRIQDSANNWTWGKITALANIISGALAGSTNIGDMTSGGGLTAAFDGTTAKSSSSAASKTVTSTDPSLAYCGKNYSGASAQAIASATIWPSTDKGFVVLTKTYTTTTNTYAYSTQYGIYILTSSTSASITVQTTANSIVAYLRAKSSSPSSASDGTLLGSVNLSGSGSSPINIPSSDLATTWNYVWIEGVASGIDGSVPPSVNTYVPGTFAYYTQTSTLSHYDISFYLSQVQFFSSVSGGVGNAVSFQVLGNAFADTTARSNWRMGVYSDTTGWPSCGTYHEGRIWLAGSQPNRMDSSVSNSPLSPLNFAPTNTSGTVLDSSAISAVFNASDVNPIFWLSQDQLGIVAGTQAGGWLVQATNNNNPLTPSTIQAHRYDRIGYANIEPKRADRTLILVQRYGRKLYEYFADVFSGKFSAQNVTWAARHLTKSGIAEIAYQQELTPIIWTRCTDGTWFGITYKRESLVSSNPPNFQAPHRHTLGSGRVVESIMVGAGSDNATDALTMVTNDLGSGIRHVEILTPIFDEGSAETSAWFLDDAVAPTAVVAGSSNCVLYGLWHLNGFIATVFAGGIDCGDWIVTNGSLTMTYGDGISGGTGGGLFTQSFAQSASFVVGFTYNSDGQIVRPATPQESGAHNGPALGKKRRSQQYAALLSNTAGISFGTDFSRLYPAIFRQANGSQYATGQMFSGVFWETLKDDYGFDGGLCWRVSRPYSASISAIEQFIHTQDK